MRRWRRGRTSRRPLTAASASGCTGNLPAPGYPSTRLSVCGRGPVPGRSTEEAEITAGRGVLTIRGQRKVRDDEQSDGTCMRRERSTYSAVRKLTLPSDVKGDQISASFLNGVLRALRGFA